MLFCLAVSGDTPLCVFFPHTDIPSTTRKVSACDWQTDPSSAPSSQKSSTVLMRRSVSATVLKNENMVISYTVHQLPSHHHWKGTPQNSLSQIQNKKEKSWSAHSLFDRWKWWERVIVVVSQTTNVGETFEFFWEVVFVEYGIGTVFHNLQRHGAEHRGEFVYALRPGKEKERCWKSGGKRATWIIQPKKCLSKMALLRKKNIHGRK